MNAGGKDAYYYRGVAHYETQKYNEALKDYEEYVRADENNSDGYYGKGRVHMALQNYGEAEHDFRTAIDIRDKNPVYYFALADCLLNQGNRDGASFNLQQGVSAYNDSTPDYLTGGCLLDQQVTENMRNDIERYETYLLEISKVATGSQIGHNIELGKEAGRLREELESLVIPKLAQRGDDH
jgi:tetratricopeptide (TPR) repeat protein